MKKILITGASGFIGGRLVEVLKETTDPEINILLRRIEKAARISRYPLNYFVGGIRDDKSIAAAMNGCDLVVHCAHDFSNPDANLEAAGSIADHCLQQNVKRLVYISSFAVHRSDTDELISEQGSLNDQWDYAVNKYAVEEKLIEFYNKKGLPVIILRPTIVYGPFSAAWTINTVNQLIGGRIVVPFDGQRLCNAVYIDDVVQAIIKALEAPTAYNGRAYIVSGSDIVTWKEFYSAHLNYKGTNAPVYIDAEESEAWQKKLAGAGLITHKNSIIKDPVSFLKKTPVYTFYQKLLKNPFLRKKLLSAKGNIPRPLIYFDKNAFEIHACKGKVDISKIKKELGFEPAFTFSGGMKKTLSWIEWSNLNLET